MFSLLQNWKNKAKPFSNIVVETRAQVFFFFFDFWNCSGFCFGCLAGQQHRHQQDLKLVLNESDLHQQRTRGGCNNRMRSDELNWVLFSWFGRATDPQQETGHGRTLMSRERTLHPLWTLLTGHGLCCLQWKNSKLSCPSTYVLELHLRLMSLMSLDSVDVANVNGIFWPMLVNRTHYRAPIIWPCWRSCRVVWSQLSIHPSDHGSTEMPISTIFTAQWPWATTQSF